MRILLVAYHRYPAEGPGSGLHPREYPSGSGYHLHDLLAQGLAEAGHEVFYQLSQGAEQPLPSGVRLVSDAVPEIDLCHAIQVPVRVDETLKFAARLGKPCLLSCHMDPRARGMDVSEVGKNWVFVSRSLAQSLGSNRFVVNGLNPSDYIFSEAKDDYLLFLSSMEKAAEKGLYQALELSQKKQIRLVVAGTAREYDTIRRIATCCARTHVEYVGDVRGRNKAELLAGARALLFPSSLNEGCPLVVLEALMSGTPVISSKHGGLPEIVSKDVGFLCAQPEEWERAVDQVGDISPRRCREVALGKFHYRRMVKDYLREYQAEIRNQQG